jgi:restriction endonuclease S subunit
MKALLVLNNAFIPDYLMAFIYGNQKSILQAWSKSGCTVESIEYEYMMNSLLPIPPIEEQLSIIELINNEKRKIDRMISTASQVVQKLKEYRTALITAAVTGKIDVRGVQLDKEAA